jgi:hypothetical protein
MPDVVGAGSVSWRVSCGLNTIMPLSQAPPSVGSTETIDALHARVQDLAHRVDAARTSRNILYVVTAFAVALSAAMGLAAGYFAGHRASAVRGIARMESGSIPVELIQQTVATGSIEFSKPFGRRPLVFICEAGHAGAFLVCKTDAISRSGFTWAVGAGPVRRDYQSELAWFAFEPE